MAAQVQNKRIAGVLIVLALTACSGCTSVFQPRAHRLLATTRQFAGFATDPAPLPRELQEQLMAEHRVEPGDILLVEPAEFGSEVRLPPDQPVLPDGSITLGTFGSMHVAGLTIDEIREEVERRLKAETDEEVPVHVRLVDMPGNVFYVLGAVNSPGAYPITGNETVLDALIAAGGVTNEADQQQIVLSKPTTPDHCRQVLPVCYLHIVQLGDTSTNYQVERGDRIYVPSLSFFGSFARNWLPMREVCPCGMPPQVPCPPIGTGLGKRLLETGSSIVVTPESMDAVAESSVRIVVPDTEEIATPPRAGEG